MRNKNLSLILCLGLFLLFTYCEEKEDGSSAEEVIFEVTEKNFAGIQVMAIKGKLSENYTFKGNVKYLLDGAVSVASGATATIEPGATFYGQSGTYFLVEQGGKIEAVGTAANPIVFTSAMELSTGEKPGDWGGVFILGQAPANTQPAKEEYTGFPYGGDVSDDNSGTLKYVKILYSGDAVDETHEANGLTLAGVGNKTTVSDIYFSKGSDDGVEFFGGTVNVKNIVVDLVEDDAIDWAYGYTGTIENVVLLLDENSDNGFECDNNSNSPDKTPISNPTVKGDILIHYTGNINPKSVAVELKAGSQGQFETISLFLKTSSTLDKGIAVISENSLAYIGKEIDVDKLQIGTSNNGMVTDTFAFSSSQELTAQTNGVESYDLSFPSWSDWILKK